MVQYLHFRILKFPLILDESTQLWEKSLRSEIALDFFRCTAAVSLFAGPPKMVCKLLVTS